MRGRRAPLKARRGRFFAPFEAGLPPDNSPGLPGEAAGAVDSLSAQVTLSPGLPDVAGATDEIHVVQYRLPPVPYQNPALNLGPNPYFTGASVTGWQAVSGTLSASGSPPSGSPQPYAALLSGTGTGGLMSTASDIPMVAGIGYLLTAWAWTPTGSVHLDINWKSAAHAVLGTSTITYTVPPGMWVQLPMGVPGGSSIPAGAVLMQPAVGSATSGSWTLWATGILLTAMAPSLSPASPVFVASTMPRMHVQNLLTGQWLHRDVQGITSPTVTWNLNNPDTLAATLSPPRADLLDSTGNPLLQEWRDAIYLEQDDLIRFGGVLTDSQFNGPAWQLTATGFAGYPNGMPYEGPNLVKYGYDALDAVRYIWGYLQGQPGGNLGLQLDGTESGYLLGNSVTNLASSTLARSAKSGQPNVWFQAADVSSFAAGDRITISTVAYQVKTIVTDTSGNATGQVTLTANLAENHSAGEQVLQVQTYDTLAKGAAAGQPGITLNHSAAFTAGQVILIGTVPYTIKTVATSTSGAPTGAVTLTANLGEAHAAGEKVVAAPAPFQLLFYNSTDCGQEIGSIQAEAVFDWHEGHSWTDATKASVAHRLSFGVPRIGSRRSDLRFAEGENIIQPVQVTRDGTKFADHVWGLGAGSGSSEIRADVSALSGQRLTRSLVYADQTVLTQARLSAKIAKVLAAAQNIDAPVQVVVKNHPNAPFGSFSCGDDIPVTLCTGWRNTIIWCRITSIAQDPTTSIMQLTVQRSDSFTYITASGLAGTI